MCPMHKLLLKTLLLSVHAKSRQGWILGFSKTSWRWGLLFIHSAYLIFWSTECWLHLKVVPADWTTLAKCLTKDLNLV